MRRAERKRTYGVSSSRRSEAGLTGWTSRKSAGTGLKGPASGGPIGQNYKHVVLSPGGPRARSSRSPKLPPRDPRDATPPGDQGLVLRTPRRSRPRDRRRLRLRPLLLPRPRAALHPALGDDAHGAVRHPRPDLRRRDLPEDPGRRRLEGGHGWE